LLKLVKFASSLDSGTVGQWVKGKRVQVWILDTATIHKGNPVAEALKCGTHCRGISQFFELNTNVDLNGMNRTCLCLPSRSWSSFTNSRVIYSTLFTNTGRESKKRYTLRNSTNLNNKLAFKYTKEGWIVLGTTPVSKPRTVRWRLSRLLTVQTVTPHWARGWEQLIHSQPV